MGTKLSVKRRALTGEPYGWPAEVPDIMQRIYAARGVTHPTGITQRLAELHSPRLLGGIERAAEILGEAIFNDRHITVAGDYDCDGATGSSVAVRGLRMLGAKRVSFVLPNRFVHGYGLSPALVDSMDPTTDVIVTVDSGVSSTEGVKRAKELGRTVVITDHHLPGDYLPDADAIVNPNLKGDPFPSKMLAGVGVMFYVLLMLRTYLRNNGMWPDGKEPDLAELLDLVAIGTVADLVPLDRNNRILVEAGLKRIRQGKGNAGINALIQMAKRDYRTLVASDIAFAIAPRLNAAGRLEDMRVGVMTLLSDDPNEAMARATILENINSQRKEIQAEMVTEAEEKVLNAEDHDGVGVVVYDPKWHSGIVGLVASKLKEMLYRPVIAFAPANEGSEDLRGSARSIPGFHLRDALAAIDAANPGLIPKFGGHAMAAGLSLHARDVERFSAEFDRVARETLSEELLNAVVYSDGPLDPGMVCIEFAQYVRSCGPWGQGFPEPVFDNVFYCEDYRIMGGKHLKLFLVDPRDGTQVDAVYFNGYDPNFEPTGYLHLTFELALNVWNGRESLQLMVRHMERSDETLNP